MTFKEERFAKTVPFRPLALSWTSIVYLFQKLARSFQIFDWLRYHGA